MLRIVFAGTPLIARNILAGIIENLGYPISAVLTGVNSISGRGKKSTPSVTKEYAISKSINVLEFAKLDHSAFEIISQYNPDVLIVVAYGLLIPQKLLTMPKYGCVNLHMSLLPKYRGAAPIQRAIIAGEPTTGVTLMQMDQGLDTGNILLQHELPISEEDTSATLSEKMVNVSLEMLNDYLCDIKHYMHNATLQQHELSTYAHKITKHEALIDWSEEAVVIARKIRAFNPNPGSVTYLNGELHKVWYAIADRDRAYNVSNVGVIVDVGDYLVVSCGKNSYLKIGLLQKAGKKIQTAIDYTRGAREQLLNSVFNQHGLNPNAG